MNTNKKNSSLVVWPRTPKFTTGCKDVDTLLHGGWSCGKQIEIFGLEGVGKTTLLLHTISEAIKRGKLVYYLDLDNSITWNWANTLGVFKDKVYTLDSNRSLFINGTLPMEDALDLIIKILPYTPIIVVDSVVNLIPRSFLKGAKYDYKKQGKILAKYIPIIQKICNKTKHNVFWINQYRFSFIDDMYKTVGSHILGFWCAYRVSLKHHLHLLNLQEN